MSLISAALGVGSLLSGFLGMRAQQGENRAARRFSRKMSDPAFIRKRAERAGFNPLLFVGPSAGLTTPAPGDAGGGALVAGMQGASEVVSAAQALALQKTELEMRNQELERINREMQFGSAIPGIYGNTKGAPGASATPGGPEGATFDVPMVRVPTIFGSEIDVPEAFLVANPQYREQPIDAEAMQILAGEPGETGFAVKHWKPIVRSFFPSVQWGTLEKAFGAFTKPVVEIPEDRDERIFNPPAIFGAPKPIDAVQQDWPAEWLNLN